MSIEKPTKNDLKAAYFHNLGQARGLPEEIVSEIGYQLDPDEVSALIENNSTRHGVILENPEDQREFDSMLSRRRSVVAGAAGKVTIKQAKQSAARNAAEHKEILGEQRRAANS